MIEKLFKFYRKLPLLDPPKIFISASLNPKVRRVVAYYKQNVMVRSSHRRCSVKNGSSSKFRKFYRKIPVLESLFRKVAGLQACTFIKKRLQHGFFSVKFAKFLRTPHLRTYVCDCLCMVMRISVKLRTFEYLT